MHKILLMKDHQLVKYFICKYYALPMYAYRYLALKDINTSDFDLFNGMIVITCTWCNKKAVAVVVH